MTARLPAGGFSYTARPPREGKERLRAIIEQIAIVVNSSCGSGRAGRREEVAPPVPAKGDCVGKKVEHIHWPGAPDLWMPYAPAIRVTGGSLVFLAGVTAAPVYHRHPHRPEEFDAMPRDMEGQARATLENLKRGLEAAGGDFGDVVTATRFVTDLSEQDALNRVWAGYFGERRPTTTTVQVARLATDPRCLLEVSAMAVVDSE